MRISISYITEILVSLPKTIYFNFRCLPFNKAIRLPFYVQYKTHLSGISKSCLKIAPNVALHPFMIKFGNKGSEGVIEKSYNILCLERGASVLFNGTASFAAGFGLNVAGELEIGHRFNANKNSFICCSKKMSFDEGVLVGWNVDIRDTDGHTVIVDGENKDSMKPVHIGHHVWIGSDAKILKGVTIGSDCIIASSAVVTKGSDENNVIWAGFPAKVIQRNANWDHRVF